MSRQIASNVALFLGLCLLLLATSAGHFFVTDEICYYFMARSFVDHGGFDVPPASYNHNLRIVQQGQDGKFYAPYSFGYPLYLTPWLLIADRLAPSLSVAWAPSFFLSFTHSVTTAAAWTLFILVLQDFGLGRRRAMAVGLAAVFSTLALPYARSLFPEPLLALCLILSLYCLRRRGSWWRLYSLLGCASLAFAVTVRPASAAFLPAFWLLLWQQGRAEQSEKGESRARFFVAPFVVAGVLVTLLGPALCTWFNYVRFGQVGIIGYRAYDAGGGEVGFNTPLWFGLAVFLLSPGKALWIFNPLVILSVLGMKKLYSEDRLTAVLVGWVFVVNLLIHSLWCEPEGGHTWGPRFFVGILPLLLLPAGLFLKDRLPGMRRKLAVAALVAMGVGIQFYGVAVNPASSLRLQRMLAPTARTAKYEGKDGRYNLLFSPFGIHHLALKQNLSGGLTLRHPLVREATSRYLIIGFPYWLDGLDFWAVHLIKEGFSRAKVTGALVFMLASGTFLLVLAVHSKDRLA